MSDNLLTCFIKNAAISGISFAVSNFKSTSCNIYSCDKLGKIIDCNEEEAKAFGINKPEGLIGLTAYDIAPENIANEYQLNSNLVLRTEKPRVAVETLLIPSGRQVKTISYKVPLRTTSKKIVGIIGVSLVLQNEKEYFLNENLIRDKLTPRQLDCLYYLVRGMTMKQIAKTLALSPKTIEHHLNAIKIKLNCDSRHKLIEKAIDIFKIDLNIL